MNIIDDYNYNKLLSRLLEGHGVDIINNNTIKLQDETFTLDGKYLGLVKMLEDGEYRYEDDIIYGKNKTELLVNLDVKDDQVHLFYSDGSQETLPMTYWLLLPHSTPRSKKLKGSQYYNNLLTFKTHEEFKKAQKLLGRSDKYIVWDLREQAMIYYGITLFKGLMLDDVSVMSWDIESDGLTQHDESIVYLITNTFYDGRGKLTKKHFRLDDYENCGEMIADWCTYVCAMNPAILNGHNIFGYDLQYLKHVASLYDTSLLLGRDGSELTFKTKPKNYRVDGSQTWEFYDCQCFGRDIIDGMFLAVKYDIGRDYPSWNLKVIAEHEGIIKEGRQFYDASKIRTNWANPVEREKIVQYGIDDSDDSYNLFKLHIPSFFYLCQNIPTTFQNLINTASGKWLNSLFVRAYVQQGYSIPKPDEGASFEGALSYGIPGVYNNMYKVDVASLYPSIMRHWKICNERKDYLKLFPTVVETFTLERLKNKKIAKDTGNPYYKALEQSQKVVINSLYGFLGAPGLNFNSHKHAAEVTRHGREILEQAIVWSTGYNLDYWKVDQVRDNDGLHLVNCDTDSIMICKYDRSEWAQEERDAYLKELNEQFPALIKWEDDGYYTHGVVVKTKNYVLVEEGSTKAKYKGSGLVDTKKEPALLEMLHLLIEDGLLFQKQALDTIYERYVQEAREIKEIKRWAVKKSITEKLLESDRANETKVVDALEGLEFSVGDKIFVFNKIEGEVQAVEKGEPVFYKKTGLPKMIPNRVLKTVDSFDGDYDKIHYLERVHATLKTLSQVVDIKQFPRYKE